MTADASSFALSTMEGLFATPLWIFDVEPERARDLNTRLRGELERLLAPLPDIPVGANWQSDQKLHRVPEYAELMDLVLEACESVLAALQVEHSPLRITACWALALGTVRPPLLPPWLIAVPWISARMLSPSRTA